MGEPPERTDRETTAAALSVTTPAGVSGPSGSGWTGAGTALRAP
ncbi:hypothetical protein [Actinocatenispora thailandica]|nr:hypothetical protein [Actinocatenispora thailandica]